jgi:predicted GIY-YIG superfamily endonuclease
MHYYVYILKCGDGTLYTGLTNDIDARLAAHREGRGAKYTRGRGPLELVYAEECPSKREAAKREYHIKKMTREQKKTLIEKRGCQK